MDGLLLINKQSNTSTRQTLNQLIKILHQKDLGTVGILDNFASGLLIVLIGEANKLLDYFHCLPKTYLAELTLFKTTDTLDSSGQVIQELSPIKLAQEEIDDAISSLKQTKTQLTPKYSNKKIDGKRLSDLTRQGISTNDYVRNIKIQELEFISLVNDLLTFRATVSKGTYIRQLGLDLAHHLGTTGYLSKLVREQIGTFSLTSAQEISEEITNYIQPLNRSTLSFLPQYVLNHDQEKKVLHGQPIYLPIADEYVLLFNYEDLLLAIYKRSENGLYISKRGFVWK